MTVFRPFPTEIILAKVESSDDDGIQRGFLLPTQGANRSYHGLRALFQYPSALSKTCGFRTFTSPTMRIVRLFLSPFPLPQHKHHTTHSSVWVHHAATPTNAHISGSNLASEFRGNINSRTDRLSRSGAPVHQPGQDCARTRGERRI